MNCRGDLVDVLSAGAAGAYRGQHYLVHRDGDVAAYIEYVCHVVQTGRTEVGRKRAQLCLGQAVLPRMCEHGRAAGADDPAHHLRQ